MSKIQSQLLYVAIILLNVCTKWTYEASRSGGGSGGGGNGGSSELASLLANDLNIIASKLDEIPETSLNIKLVLMAYECNDVKLNWKIPNGNQNFRYIRKKLQLDSPTSSSKIFGYQVVVREYLEEQGTSYKKYFKNNSNKPNRKETTSDKTLRVYSSKFIDSNQNKFKLINILRKNQASYQVCLVIYMDVTETVAFEKQCVSFSLPPVSAEVEKSCKAQKALKVSKNSKTTTAKQIVEENAINNVNELNSIIDNNISLNKTRAKPKIQQTKNFNQFLNTNQFKCEHVSQCRHYSNLLTAFVVCCILLGTNLFMFTIIIIQNTIKLNFLRKKLDYIKKYQRPEFHQLNDNVTAISNGKYDKSFYNNSINENEASGGSSCCLISTFKWAVNKSCWDIVSTLCLGNFNGRREKNVQNLSKMNSKNTNSLMDQGCTTITRPGYILQVPNTTISSNSMINASGTNTFFTRTKVLDNNFTIKSNFNTMNDYKHKYKKPSDMTLTSQQTSQIKSNDTFISSTFIDHDIKELDFDKEIFFHKPNRNNSKLMQLGSSAF